MPPIIKKIILAVIIAVAVTLGCYLLGLILVALKVEIAITVGNFLKQYGSVIGILAGLWFLFADQFNRPRA